MFSVPRGGSLAVWTCFLIEPYLSGFSYSCLMVPSNCLCLIFVCHFLCLFRANSKSWIGWQTRDRLTLGCQGDAKPSAPPVLPSGSEVGRSAAERNANHNAKTVQTAFWFSCHLHWANVIRQGRKRMCFLFSAHRLLACPNELNFSDLCCSLNPGENPRWQHLSSSESSHVKWMKVTSKEE